MPDTITLLGSLAGLDLQAVVGKAVWVRVHYAPDGKLLGGTEPPGTVLDAPGYAPTGYGSARALITDEQGLFGGVLPWEDGGIYRVDVPGDVTRYLMMGTGVGEHPAGSTVNVRRLPGPDEVVTPSVALEALVDGAVEDYLTEHPPTGVTDHGELTGLSDDAHPHYLTAARGDARYVQPGALAPVATAGDYASLTGTVPTSALPPLAINTVSVVATQAAMLALTAERGDMAIRTDTGRTYVLASDSPATLADWKEVTAAGQAVSGAAGGDLSGTYPNPTVAKLAGVTPGTAGLNVLAAADAAAARSAISAAPASPSGTGSPQGVVTAPVGTIYTDTAATAGAVRWLKTAGSGNTGWSVLYGDTGWRYIHSLLINGAVRGGAAAPGGGTEPVRIRRIGQIVYAQFSIATPSWTSGTTFMTLPTGFQGAPSYLPPPYASVASHMLASANGEIRLYQTGSSVAIRNAWTWPTDAPWPATLPGSDTNT